MSNDYRTCTYTYDSGRTCNSAAAQGRESCGYHLRYRGRLLRTAQARARNPRFDITLPPLDSLCSIQSALCPVAEAEASNIQRAAKKLLAEKLAATGKKTPVSAVSDAAKSASEESKNTA